MFLSAFLIFPILQGCVEDDLSVCGITIDFVFTKNVEGVDKFATNVNKINLFVYDSGGNYIGEYSAEGDRLHSNSMALNLLPGVYTLIAWGNICDDYELYNTTNFGEAELSLKRTENIVSTHPGDLYHGGLYQLKVDPDLKANQRDTIELTKNTNNIKVTTKGMPYDEETKSSKTTYSCSIVSNNGDYKFDNEITGTDRLQYIAKTSINEDKEKVSDFVVMRELNNNITQSQIVITRNEEDKIPVDILQTDLVPILISASLTGDLDIEDEFEIEIIITETNGTTTIKIDDWEYVIGGGIV